MLNVLIVRKTTGPWVVCMTGDKQNPGTKENGVVSISYWQELKSLIDITEQNWGTYKSALEVYCVADDSGFVVFLTSLRTYSRKSKEGHADHAECGCQQASIPGLGNLVTITNGGESDLVKHESKSLLRLRDVARAKECLHFFSDSLVLPVPTTVHQHMSQTPHLTPFPQSTPGMTPGWDTESLCTTQWWVPAEETIKQASGTLKQ